jgi:hypothetical protein
MEARKKDSYQTTIYDFVTNDIFVECPNCEKKALIKATDFSFRQYSEENIKLVCTNCGHNKKLIEKPDIIITSQKNDFISGRHYVIGGGIDPFFHLKLWLTKNCGENLFWAYNYQHLDFIYGHVGAKLRERNGQTIINRSLGSRLPKWMTSNKNREQILKIIDELRDKN